MNKRIRITALCHDAMVDTLVNTKRGCVQTCGFIPLAWVAGDKDSLTVCMDTPPYCILQDSKGTIWLYGSEPSGKVDGIVLWRRADAIAEAGKSSEFETFKPEANDE